MKQRRLHLGDLRVFAPRISLLKQSSPVKASGIYYDALSKVRSRFPAHTKAFLYYSAPAERPRMAGELRLRLASDDNFASFESGSDLLQRNGRPWSLPLYCVSKYSSYRLLYEKLREERLVPDDLDAALSTLPAKMCTYSLGHVLFTLNDPFILNLNAQSVTLLIITGQGVEKVRFYSRIEGPYTGGYLSKCLNSYSDEVVGSVLARFERSTLAKHEGTRTIVLRILKTMTVTPDGPKEGELYCKLKQRVWSVDIDKSVVYRGLQLLY
jgi:hypothetical protein